MRPWNEIIAEARDIKKEREERKRRLRIVKAHLKGSDALRKAQGKRKSRLTPDELKLRERDTITRERRQDTREKENERKDVHSKWVIGQTAKNAEEKKKQELENIKNKPKQVANAALSGIKTQSISSKDSDATAYTKTIGNVGSFAGGIAKAGIGYLVANHKAKKEASEIEGKRSSPIPFKAPKPPKPPTIKEKYFDWRDELLAEQGLIFEVGGKTDNKTEKKKIIDVLPPNKTNKVELNPNMKEEKDEEGGMAHNELATMERAVKTLRKKIKSPNQQLPAWVQSKISKAADHIDTVADYMSGETEPVSEGYDDMNFRHHAKGTLDTSPTPTPSEKRSRTAGVLKLMKQVNADVEKPKKKKKKKSKDVVEDCGCEDDKKKVLMMAIIKKVVDAKKKKNSQLNSGIIGEESAAWQRKEGKNPEGGLNKKGIASYRKENPGSNLSLAVTTKPSKLKKGSKSANRRKSFCSRMSGMKAKLTSAKTANDPNSRINKSLRKWNC